MIMKPYGLNELREMFLRFFETKGHLRLPSFSLIPQDDASLLLINSGMAPMKPYFKGDKEPPRHRVCTCQKCIRTGDIENIGKTARHGTYFEMLGNFSFGDYFKHEAIAWSWEFLTSPDWVGLDPERLYPSVYEKDDEAFNIWRDEIGIPESRITRLGKDDNFWEHGSGPCGPCSEIYFDRGEAYGCGKPDCAPGCDCDRYMEVWNNVFSQFDNDGNGNYSDLIQKNIDTGMGLERLAVVCQGVDSLFDVDTVMNITHKVSEITGAHYGDSHKTDVSLRVITDHIRASVMMISDGILPSNEGRGYVLRRLLRRAARHGKLLGVNEPFLYQIVDMVVHENECQYPELREKQVYITRVIRNEEENFAKTIDAGMHIFSDLLAEHQAKGERVFSGADAFKLYDTYGFPIDLTELIAREQDVEVDLSAFETELQAQKERSRNAAAVATDDWQELFPLAQSEFVGYDTLTAPVRIARYRRVSAKNRTTYQLVFDRTPFYGNSGGQIGDVGFIENADEKIDVVATDKENGLIIHIVDKLPENPAADFTAVVDPAKRQAAANNHTATHLLDAALRKVLGTHVEQKGSFVTPDYLRFDFSHFRKVTPAELREVERLVNREIRANHPLVERRDATLAEAQAEGAIMLFGEKYGDRVRMVRFGDSVELCGGTHTCATGTIGFFKIVSESAVSAGVRRIEAVTGEGAEKVLYAAEDTLQNVAEFLNNTQVVQAIKKIVESNDALSKEVEAMRQEQVREWADRLVKSLPEQNGVILMAKQSERMPAFIKDLAYNLRARVHNLVMVVGTCQEGKPSLTIMLGDDVVAKGVNAGKVIREAAREMNGGGGGQPFFATAGGKNPDKLQAAIDKAVELIMDELK